MSIKRNVNFIVDDLKGTNGFVSFMNALMHSIFIVGIFILITWAICTGQADYPSVCAGLVLAFFILGNFGRDKKLGKMEKQIKDDEVTINKLSRKEISINVDKIDAQMKEMQDE